MQKALGLSCFGAMTERDTHNLRVFNAWMLSAATFFAISTILMAAVRLPEPVQWTIPAVEAILGMASIRAYVIFLRHADELLRKIQVEGLALGFGVGVFFMLVWRLCERAGAPKLDVDDPFILMMLAWGLGSWLGMRHYADGEGQ